LWGESGVGKSGLMYMLATDLLRIDGIPRDTDGDQILRRRSIVGMLNKNFGMVIKINVLPCMMILLKLLILLQIQMMKLWRLYEPEI
jgi:ABC-type phosphate/phosphonate transport system ATPase subunit